MTDAIVIEKNRDRTGCGENDEPIQQVNGFRMVNFKPFAAFEFHGENPERYSIEQGADRNVAIHSIAF